MQSDRAGLANRNNEALDVDGKAVASADQIATQGTFFAQTGNFEGTQRRLVFGDFDVQRDGDTGSTTLPSTERSLGSRCSQSKPCLDTIWAAKWRAPTFVAA
jgi:hypothetical protein